MSRTCASIDLVQSLTWAQSRCCRGRAPVSRAARSRERGRSPRSRRLLVCGARAREPGASASSRAHTAPAGLAWRCHKRAVFPLVPEQLPAGQPRIRRRRDGTAALLRGHTTPHRRRGGRAAVRSTPTRLAPNPPTTTKSVPAPPNWRSASDAKTFSCGSTTPTILMPAKERARRILIGRWRGWSNPTAGARSSTSVTGRAVRDNYL